MRRFVLAVALWLFSTSAYAALAIDCGGASCGQDLNSLGHFVLSTTNTNDIIIVAVLYNGTSVSTVSSTNTTGWTRIGTSGGTNPVELWWGKASSALVGETIVVTPVGSPSFFSLAGWGISGANFSSGTLDCNAALPSTNGNLGGTVSETTTVANDMLIAAYRFNSTSSPTAGTGWTAPVTPGDFLLPEYDIVSATQSGVTVPIGTGNTDQNGGVASAVTILNSTCSASTVVPLPMRQPFGIGR